MSWVALRRISAGAIQVGVLTLVIKVLALAKEMALAQRFGASAEFDSYVLALAVVFFIVNLLMGNFAVAYIPVYLELPSESARKGLAGRVLTSWLVGGLALAVMLWVGADFLPALFPRMDPTSRALLPTLLRGLAPLVAITAGGALLSASLQAREHFTVPALAPGLTTLLVISTALLYPGARVTHIVGATVVGAMAEGVLLGARLRAVGAAPIWTPLQHEVQGARRVWSQLLPVISGGLIMNSTTLVDAGVAAWLQKGTVSQIAFAGKLPSVAITLVATALSTAALPALSRQVAAKDWIGLREVLRKGPLLLLAVTVPLTAILVGLSEPLVRLFFERGAFTSANTRFVSDIQTIYLLQIPFYSVGILFMGAIAAMGQNRILLVGTLISAGLNLGLDLALVPVLGPRGIAMSTVGVYIVACLFLGYHAHRLVRAESSL